MEGAKTAKWVCRGDKDGEMNLSFEGGKVFERPNKKRPRVSPGDRSGVKAKRDWKKGSKKGLEKQQMKREARKLQIWIWWKERPEEAEHS